MTCEEIRDLFSARVDDALTADERARVDAHLATCAECGREWQGFEATVGLLRAVEPARAPTGVVDRLLAVRPQPWYRRLVRELLVPWPVKLPLEAAAVVLIAGLAIMIFQRSPELRQASRVPEPPPVATPAPTERADQPAAVEGREPSAPREERSRDAAEPKRTEPPATLERRDAVRGQPRQTGVERRAKEAPTALDPQGKGDAAQSAPAPAAPRSAGQKAAKEEAPASRRQALATPPDVEARLTVDNREMAEQQIRTIVARLGGSVAVPSPELVEVAVPRRAWDELARELTRLGTLRIDRGPSTMPTTVRLSLRVN